MIPSYLLPLANHIWQSTLFAAAAGLLAFAVRNNRAAIRHWLWFAASVKFLLPFGLLVSIADQVHWPTAPVVSIRMPLVLRQIDEIDKPFVAPAPSTHSFIRTGTPRRDPLRAILMTIWLCGFGICVLGWLNQWRKLRSLLRRGVPMNLDAPIRAMSCPKRLEPGVFGIVHPVLLLPEGIHDRLTAEELEAIVAHELCHVRRHDNLVAAVHMLVDAIFWFYPLVWWLGFRLLEEQEAACDEEVLRLGNDPQTYAEGILKVCEFYLQSPIACVSGVTGADLKKRIRNIMRRGSLCNLAFHKKVLLVAAGFAAIGAPIVVGILEAQSPAIPKWEVVSIKPCTPGAAPRLNADPQNFTMLCSTVAGLIYTAYVLNASGRDEGIPETVPIEGGPAWIQTDHYSISAKAEEATTMGMMQGPMMQAILEDRFKLKIRREIRDVPAYALTVAKDGPKLQPAKECLDEAAISDGGTGKVQEMIAEMRQAGHTVPPPCGGGGLRWLGPNRTTQLLGMSLDQFVTWLAHPLGRPVSDKTGISGIFDIHLEFFPDDSTPGIENTPPPLASLPANARPAQIQAREEQVAHADDPAGPSLPKALQEQLGLKLESSRGPGKFLVIEHVERPTPN